MLEGKLVLVEVLEDHTYDGIAHAAGTRYEAEEAHVEFLELRGYARRVPADEAPRPAEPTAHGEHAHKTKTPKR